MWEDKHSSVLIITSFFLPPLLLGGKIEWQTPFCPLFLILSGSGTKDHVFIQSNTITITTPPWIKNHAYSSVMIKKVHRVIEAIQYMMTLI